MVSIKKKKKSKKNRKILNKTKVIASVESSWETLYLYTRVYSYVAYDVAFSLRTDAPLQPTGDDLPGALL